MKRTLFLLLLLLSTPAFAITINTLDLNEIDDTTIEITAPVWAVRRPGRCSSARSNRSSTAGWPTSSAAASATQ